MRIGLIVETTFPPVNRANLRLYRLARVLVGKGHKAYLISPSELPWLRKNLNHQGIEGRQYLGFGRYLYSSLRAGVRGLHLAMSILLVVYLNFRNKFDVLQAWNPLAGLAAILASGIVRRPVFIDFTDFYSDIAETDSNKLTAGLLRKIEIFVLRKANRVIVVSEIMRQRLIAKGITGDKIEIVEDGVDKDMFKPDVKKKDVRRELKLTDSEPIIVYHGDIKPPDGVDILFRAFKKVLTKTPEAKLLILGGGGEYFENLKEEGKRLKIDKSIIYTGWVDHQEVPKYLAASDIGAMPMRATLNHQCYLSFKLFEYWASGKPVVTTRLKAISRIVQDGHNGRIVEAENVDQLAQAIIDLLQNPSVAQELGRNGRALVESKFDWDLLMKKEIHLYKNIKAL